MSCGPIITALAIPAEAIVAQRIPKKLLLEQGAPTAADKRQIQDGIDEMTWVAALKPTNIGIPVFQDAVREYLEIAVLTVALRPTAKPPRIIDLIHRAIPYPLVLVTEQGETGNLSLAHKRRSQGQDGKMVIEEVHQVQLRPDKPESAADSFLASLAISCLPSRDLFALYQGWLDRVAAFHAAMITGVFAPPCSEDRAVALRDDLRTVTRLQREIAALRTQAAKEKQLNRRVELNLKIRLLEAELAQISDQLNPETVR